MIPKCSRCGSRHQLSTLTIATINGDSEVVLCSCCLAWLAQELLNKLPVVSRQTWYDIITDREWGNPLGQIITQLANSLG